MITQLSIWAHSEDGRRMTRQGWFLLGMLALIVLSAYTLTQIGVALTATPATTSSSTTSGGQTSGQTTSGATSAGGVSVLSAHEQVYPLKQANPGVMYPTVDAQGNIWFGEMGLNALARLDPRTGAVSSWSPPNGRNNIMQTVVDTQGNIWFAEQAANYIGRFDPATQAFTTYPLANVNGHGAAPQDLAFDAQGRLWFTETVGQRIGRLDPTTGQFTFWPLPNDDANTPAYAYALALAPDGSVWYGSLSGGVVGRLDPTTGKVTLHHLRSAQTSVFAMASDAQGRIWCTELLDGRLGVINTTTGQVTELNVPTTLGNPSGLYGVAVTPDGSVWFASAGANALVRYTPTTGAWAFYQVTRANSIPYGLALETSGGHNTLWFTADGVPNYVGAMNV
ncbi:MAG TPA: hypothetical protein VKQ36_08985 [Ktedonobacterales bacterium]|nr:hypothetical protein [Ktedonobacterales bacterium]